MKRRRASKQRLIAMLAVAMSFLLSLVLPAARASGDLTIVDHDLQETVAPIISRYLAVLHRSGPNESPAPTVEMSDLSPGNRNACLALVESALTIYPDQLLKAFVRTVALADDVRVWGTMVGGVQGPQILGINCLPAERPIVGQVVHGAMAGKVLDLAPPDWAAWAQDNPANFTYGDPTPFREALARPDAALVDRRLNAAGFVGRIGLTDREADFQTYAEQMFGDGPAFATTVRANPAMRNKLRLVIEAYLFVAPDLRPYFERTGLLAAAPEPGR